MAGLTGEPPGTGTAPSAARHRSHGESGGRPLAAAAKRPAFRGVGARSRPV